jgi:hypothetical protein
MSPRVQNGAAWCGPIFVVVFFVGMILAGFLPPPSPHDSPHEVTLLYSDHTDLVRFGLFLMMVSAGFTGPFAAVISVQLRRIEGNLPTMTYTQLLGGAIGVLAIVVPMMIFTAAAFRPDRSPELTQALNDLAWLPFIMNFVPAMLQCISIAVAVFSDRRENPVFPRWVGYYNVWTTLLFIPGGLVTFFKHGPFAWNGLFAFWVAAAVFGSWFIVMSVAVRQAVGRAGGEDV